MARSLIPGSNIMGTNADLTALSAEPVLGFVTGLLPLPSAGLRNAACPATEAALPKSWFCAPMGAQFGVLSLCPHPCQAHPVLRLLRFRDVAGVL